MLIATNRKLPETRRYTQGLRDGEFSFEDTNSNRFCYIKQEWPPNGGGSAKRDITHSIATAADNTCYHMFRKRSYMTEHRLACAS